MSGIIRFIGCVLMAPGWAIYLLGSALDPAFRQGVRD